MKYLLPFLILSIFSGCAVRQCELCENKIVKIASDEYSQTIFETKINTKGYKYLRIFAHIYNEQYSLNPIPQNAYFKINAFYGIGQGSWGYHSARFNHKSTSGWAGVTEIPIVGEETRIGIYAFGMPDIELKVDVTSVLY